MKIWLIYKVGMAFRINIHGRQPYPRHGHLYTKSAQKTMAIVSHCNMKFSHNFSPLAIDKN